MVRAYFDKDENPQATFAASHDPSLKAKVVRVMAESMIKQGGRFKKVYDDYKARLETHPKYKDVTKTYRHNMAMRYMVKQFLIAYHKVARAYYGLKVYPSYHEAMMGHTHKAA